MTRHFLDLDRLPEGAPRAILDEAVRRKQARGGRRAGMPDDDAPLSGAVLAMIFEKSSTRTRVSFEVAIRQLGGSAIFMNAGDMQLGRGETVSDTAKVLSRYVDAVMLRANSHATLTELAAASSVPVINGLTDLSHPCQIMADLLTYEEHVGPLSEATLAWVGDGNNVCQSFIQAAPLFGFKLNIACPQGLGPDPDVVHRARAKGAAISFGRDPVNAATGATAVITDTWVSMGDKDGPRKRQMLAPFQVTDELMAVAAPNAIFLHCLPAHRGEEVEASVIDGPQSRVFDEAENRIHAQKAILTWCLGVF